MQWRWLWPISSSNSLSAVDASSFQQVLDIGDGAQKPCHPGRLVAKLGSLQCTGTVVIQKRRGSLGEEEGACEASCRPYPHMHVAWAQEDEISAWGGIGCWF